MVANVIKERSGIESPLGTISQIQRVGNHRPRAARILTVEIKPLEIKESQSVGRACGYGPSALVVK
jgi:hypothetical protein